MDFVTVWSAKEWSDADAAAIAAEALRRSGREVPFVEWADPDGDGLRDPLAVAEAMGLSDRDFVALVIAYGDASGFSKQLDAHARRMARRNPSDPDHYGS